MLIKGIASFEAFGKRPDDCICCLQVRLVAVHDHKMRFVGHHCLALDCTRERELEARLGGLQMRLEDAELSLVTAR
jgi:hypothetical protein